jgi:hypothetical protein
VRLEQHIRQREETRIEVGFALEDIEGRRTELPAFERVKQSLLVDVGSTADIDQHTLGPQRLDHLGTDDMSGGSGSRQRHKEEIRTLRERHGIGDEFPILGEILG